jgi:two-component system chemotaxis response regulator CheY
LAKVALIVDDSNTMRQMVGFALKGAGFEVVEGGNGQEGLDKARTVPKLDLIITDLNMPIMDGLQFIREARTLANHRFTPILMLTTEGGDDRKAQGKAAGATGWIVKPFQPDQLLKVVEKVCP